MNRKIGKILLDYTNYSGEDLYSDGEIEDELLDACINGTEEKLLKKNDKWAILYHLSDIRENVIAWYPIRENAEILEIGSGCGGITGVLSKRAKSVTCVELSEKRSLINANRHREKNNITIKLGNFQDVEPGLGKYDYVTLIGVLEYSQIYIDYTDPFHEMLKIVRKHLKDDGQLIIAIENKMGLKYWNGATEDHTGKLYSGLNDYVDEERVRTFSINELQVMLKKAGYKKASFYCPVPDYKLPQAIYSYEFQPRPGAVRTYKKVYSAPRFYNFLEDVVSDQLCSDGMYGYMANSFIAIAGNSTDETVLYAKYNRERKNEYRLATIIKEKDGERKVIKIPLNQKAIPHILAMENNRNIWNGTLDNVECVEGKVIGDFYESDYVDGISFDEILYGYRTDPYKFTDKVKSLVDEYLKPKESELIPFKVIDKFIDIFGSIYPKNAKSMRISNVDALFSNIKIGNDGKAYAYDFEWVFDFPIPYRYLIWRAEKEVYCQYQAYLNKKLKKYEYFNILGFDKDEIKLYEEMEKSFNSYVCGQKHCEEYTSKYIKPTFMQETRFC